METIEKIMREMCRRVDADYDSINFKDDNDPYYSKYEWTKEEQDDFEDWLINLFLTSKKDYKNMSVFRNNKKNRKIVASQFISIYGWKETKSHDNLVQP